MIIKIRHLTILYKIFVELIQTLESEVIYETNVIALQTSSDDDICLAWPTVVQLLDFLYSGTQQISYEYSSLFIKVINLIFYIFALMH